MVNKRKSRKRLRNRIKNRKNSRRHRTIRKKLKKDIFNVTDLFQNIDIDPLEYILESIVITTQHNTIRSARSACSTSNLVLHSSSEHPGLVKQ
jgi:hypothetical protein